MIERIVRFVLSKTKCVKREWKLFTAYNDEGHEFIDHEEFYTRLGDSCGPCVSIAFEETEGFCKIRIMADIGPLYFHSCNAKIMSAHFKRIELPF